MAVIEHPSGKGTRSENFPVASWLIAAHLRPHVLDFYRFARAADDVADAPDLSPAEKLARLDRMADVLDGGPRGGEAPAASTMRESLRACGVPFIHCHQLLDAFRQDAVKSRYADWSELMDYCRLSAAPVGRFLLDLHGEAEEGWRASDQLCAALQVINHLQDCGEDYRLLDRVYLPLDMLDGEAVAMEELAGRRCGPGLRRVLDRVVAETLPLVAGARLLPGMIKDAGLRAEAAVIDGVAERLLDQLARRDPLAGRVRLGPAGMMAAFASGLTRGLWGRGGR